MLFLNEQDLPEKIITQKGDNGMGLKKSFVARMLLILLVCFVGVETLAGVSIYAYSRQTVGKEFVRLNQAALNQVASSTGDSLAKAINFTEQVSVNNRILSLATHSDKEAEKKVHRILSVLQGEFSSSLTDGANLTEVYVLGKNGLCASSFNSGHYTWESVYEDSRCKPLIDGSADMLLLPSQKIQHHKGVLSYSFQVVRVMRDLLSGEMLGFVLMDVSELMLFDQYNPYQQGDMDLQVINSDGIILSHRDKRKIGSSCGYNQENLEKMNESNSVNERISDGQLRLFARIPASDWFLVAQQPEQEVFGALIIVRKVLLIVGILCTGSAFIAIILVSRRLQRRISKVCDGMEQMRSDDLSVRLVVENDDEFGYIEGSFNSMAEEMEKLVEAVRRSEQQKRVAEMDFLHAQINSHFIHNTLTSIRFMLEMGHTNEAGEMLFYFSKLLRETLTHSSEFIPLRKEIDTLQSYVKLQWYRYQNTFEASYDIAEDVMDVPVPALIMQPVVENAIFHGVGQKFTHITISAHGENGKLLLVVEDDGVGMSDDVRRSILQKEVPLNHVGLRNVHDRIQLCYGSEYGLHVDSQVGKGTKITFTLPLETEKGSDADEPEYCGSGR